MNAAIAAGATLLLAAERAHGGQVRIDGASRAIVDLLARIRAIDAAPPRRGAPS